MTAFITEDALEQSGCKRVAQPAFGWKRIVCNPNVEAKDDVSLTGCSNAWECILPEVFRSALYRLNPDIQKEKLDNIVEEYRRDFFRYRYCGYQLQTL